MTIFLIKDTLKLCFLQWETNKLFICFTLFFSCLYNYFGFQFFPGETKMIPSKQFYYKIAKEGETFL